MLAHILGPFLRRMLLRVLSGRKLPAPTEREFALAREFRETLDELAARNDSDGKDAFWVKTTAKLRELVTNDDPRRFLRWDIINYIMASTITPYVRHECAELKISPEWDSRWKALVEENWVGNHLPYFAYQHTIHGFENIRYFNGIAASMPNHAASVMEFPHRPGNSYMTLVAGRQPS